MKTIDVYEIGEEVYITAKIDELIIENGEPKYKVSPVGEASSLTHKYTHHELKPVPKKQEAIDVLQS